MPTDPAVFAAVAHNLGGADPNDEEAVARFYRRLAGRSYTPVQRDLVFGFLLASESMPSGADLARLATMVAKAKRHTQTKVLPLSKIPTIKHRQPVTAAE